MKTVEKANREGKWLVQDLTAFAEKITASWFEFSHYDPEPLLLT